MVRYSIQEDMMGIKQQQGYTPVTDPMTCEICGASVALADTHSIIVCYAMPGKNKASYQCKNEQHFGCTHEHAMLAALACLFGHIEQGDHTGAVSSGNYADTDLKAISSALVKYSS